MASRMPTLLALVLSMVAIWTMTDETQAGKLFHSKVNSAIKGRTALFHEKKRTLESYAPGEKSLDVVRRASARDKDSSVRKGPPCTAAFDFVYVARDKSVTFRSLFLGIERNWPTTCGWWFWTDPTNKLELSCDYIDIRDSDNMIIYDPMDSDNPTELTDYQEEMYVGRSAIELAIGMESNQVRQQRSFECKISSSFVPVLEYVTVWAKGYSDVKVPPTENTRIRALKADSAADAIELPGTLDGNDFSLALGNGKLFACRTMDTSCWVYNLGESDPWEKVYESTATWTDSPAFLATADELWLFEGLTVTVVQLADGTAEALNWPFATAVECSSKIANDGTDRYLLNSGGDNALFYNTNNTNPIAWQQVTPGNLSPRTNLVLLDSKIHFLQLDSSPEFQIYETSDFTDISVFVGQQLLLESADFSGIYNGKYAHIGGSIAGECSGNVRTFHEDDEPKIITVPDAITNPALNLAPVTGYMFLP